jgi:ectoine hydroxylase-related dioxygenase (phytanoyl-CoA dioxygenase family)
LPPEATTFYRENGFLVIEDALSSDEVNALNRETVAICRGERGDVRGTIPAAPDETDEEVLRRILCIHFPHKISSLMRNAVIHPSEVSVLTQVIGPNVKCMQSMLFIKASGKPGQAWHQDEYFIPTRDRSLTGGWIALDDATIENGCLWVIPGSQKPGIIWPTHSHGDKRFDCTGESIFPYEKEGGSPVEVKAGSIVFFNGYLLHRSLPNTAKGGYRRALVNHYMSAESLLPWMRLKEGEALALADFRDIIMVAGEDPYAYKGVEEITIPHVRPSGEGGCGDPRHNSKEGKPPEDPKANAMASPMAGSVKN